MRFLVALLLWAGPVWADAIEVPSGQFVTLAERLHEPDGPAGETIRYRFLAPEISRDGGTVSVEAALADIDALCGAYVLGDLAKTGDVPAQVVISLMDRFVSFGTPDPNATQIFEAYRIEDGTCIWEPL